MVHSNMLMHFSGHVTDSFDREFRCMYADSQIIDCFYNPDDEGLPSYSHHMPVPNFGLDFLADYGSRERVYSEHSSSQSSDSVSSIKAAPPGMKPIKVTTDKKNPENSQKPPDRKGVTSPVLQKPSGPHIRRGSPSGIQAVERTSLGQTAGVEWSKIGATDYQRANIPGQASKIQTLGLYSSPKPPSPTQQSPTDNKITSPAVFPALNLSTTLSAPAQLTHSVLTVYGCNYHYFSTEVRVQQAFDYQMVYLCKPSMERLFHRSGKKRRM